MSANLPYKDNRISAADDLSGERLSASKNEYIDGKIYATVGVSRNHAKIAGNRVGEFGHSLQDQPPDYYRRAPPTKPSSA
jgi:hypothetical protein